MSDPTFDYSLFSPNHIEIFPLQVDVEKLLHHFEKHILPIPPISRSAAIAGWSLQSLDGSYQSGMELGFLPNNGPENQGPKWTPRNEAEAELATMQDFKVPSVLCAGPFLELLQKVEAMGLHPRRARILRLAAGTQSTRHVDGQPQVYSLRLHVPIITNRLCHFCFEDESFHMAADGNAYLVVVNRLHKIQNRSSEHRYHVVMNVWDRNHVTRFHPYTP